MKKVVINACYGGFSISREAVLLARQLSGNTKWGDCVLENEAYEDGTINNQFPGNKLFNNSFHIDVDRADPILVQVVETLGPKSWGSCAELKVEIVTGKYRINEYDGLEYIETPDDIQWSE